MAPALPIEYVDPAADTGSCCKPYCDAKDKFDENEPAEVGPLTAPSNRPNEPDRECAALLSLPPLAD